MSVPLYDENKPWQCFCGFHNEGLEPACSSCGISRADSVMEMYRQVQALQARTAGSAALHPLPAAGSTPQGPATTPLALHQQFSHLLMRDAMPYWREALESIPVVGPWLNRPSPGWTIFVLKFWAWVLRIIFLLHAFMTLLFGAGQLLMPDMVSGFNPWSMDSFATAATGAVVKFVVL